MPVSVGGTRVTVTSNTDEVPTHEGEGYADSIRKKVVVISDGPEFSADHQGADRKR